MKIIKIDRCDICPYAIGEKHWCSVENREIMDSTMLPNWCLLEDNEKEEK